MISCNGELTKLGTANCKPVTGKHVTLHYLSLAYIMNGGTGTESILVKKHTKCRISLKN